MSVRVGDHGDQAFFRRKERTEVEMMSRCDPCRSEEGMKVEEKKIYLPYCPTDEDAPTMTIG